MEDDDSYWSEDEEEDAELDDVDLDAEVDEDSPFDDDYGERGYDEGEDY